MASELDVLPRRNLGPAEPWGRQIEDALIVERKAHKASSLLVAGDGRATSATLSGLASQAKRLQNSLLNVPTVFAKSATTNGFAVPLGWFTGASLTLTPPPGKKRLDITAYGRGIANGFFNMSVTTPGPSAGVGSSGAFVWPFPTSIVSSEFGHRAPLPYHNGIDFGAGSGTPVIAMADGVVSYVQNWGGGTGGMDALGNYVRLSHGVFGGKSLMTGYAHFQGPPLVAHGQRVTRGMRLGYVGNTGYSFGAHLHLETWVDGARINPRVFMATYGNSSPESAPVDIVTTVKRGSSALWSRILIGSVTSREFAVVHGDGNAAIHMPVWGASIANVTGPVAVHFQFQSQRATEADANNFAVLTTMGAFS